MGGKGSASGKGTHNSKHEIQKKHSPPFLMQSTFTPQQNLKKKKIQTFTID